MASHDAGWALICIDCAGSAGNYRQNWERFFWGGFEGGLLVDASAFIVTNTSKGRKLKVNECLDLLSSDEMFSGMTLPQKRCCGLENCTPDVLLQAELTLLNWRNSLSC
jgi:hypothetical protein